MKTEFQKAATNEQLTTNKTKIVRIIARLNVGGPARHVVWLTKELQNDEFKSVLLAGTVPDGEEDMSYFADENDVEPIFIPEMSRELSIKDAVSLWKIFRLIRSEKPDIIHTHTAKAGTVGRIAGFLYRWLAWTTFTGKPRRVALVHTYHGHVFHSYYGNLKTKVFLLIEKFLARTTDKIIVISRQQFDEIHGRFKVGRERQFEILPLGIDLELFAGTKEKRRVLREEIGAGEDEILVGLIGRLTEVKNHQLFLRAAKIYLETQPPLKIKFIVIGDGHLRKTIEAESGRLGVRDSVIFLGNRSDADVFFAGLDIVALTSLNEGTPLSLIEAMANEKAVISTRVGGVEDLLGETREEKSGFQICERGIAATANDAKGFYDGLIYLAQNTELRKALGTRGKDFVRANYSKNRLAEDVKNLYRALTAG